MVVVLVLLAAAVGALALVLLRKATQSEPQRPAFSLALLWLLMRHRPVWALGIAAMITEFVLQIIALANGPVSMVQLLVVMELPFCLILSRLILGGRLHAREWSAISAMTTGVIVLLLILSPHGGDSNSVHLRTWLVGLAVTIAGVVAALVVGRWTRPAARTALAGIAAGMTAGLIAVLVKSVTSILSRGIGAVLAGWQIWAVLVVGAGAFLLQNALQAGRLVASQPGITLANPLVATAWGVAVFHEQVRTGWWLLGAAVGVALLAGGAVLLSGSPLLVGYHEGPDYEPSLGTRVEHVPADRVPDR
jgi:drug/metabolite transporter (DMT)-like permease